MDVPQRFLDKVHPPNSKGCSLWRACKNKAGYGYFSWQRKNQYAHRLIWEWTYGPIPDGLEIDHVVCDTPSCVNVKHLALATSRNNTLRSRNSRSAINARKTHCDKEGHPLSGSNLRIDPSGRRVCIECKRAENRTDRARDRKREWYRKKHGVTNPRKP